MVSDGDAPKLEADIDRFFTRFDELLELGDDAALQWVDAAEAAIKDLDDWALCRADALLVAKGPAEAIDWLQSLLAQSPGFADAHYRLAELHEFEHELESAIAHHLSALKLDGESDELTGELEPELLERVSRAAANAIAELPESFRSRLAHVPILLDTRPSAELVREGYDSRSLGLFSGPNHAEPQLGEVCGELTEIRLYTRCLWDAFGLDETELLEQVRITVLHEVGHYFGLDEAELTKLGLD